MGKSTKPYWRGNIKCLKLAAGMGAAGRGSLTASHLFFIIIIFTHKGSVPLKKKILSTVLDVLITKKGYYFTRRFTKAERKLFVSKKDDEACLLKSM